MSDTVGWGIVGIGSIATSTIAPAMVAEDQCELIAVTSRDQGRADEFAHRFAALRAYTSYEAMVHDPDIEAVFIATPNALHGDQVCVAAAAGLAVLCDKPLATNPADAERAVDACRRAGVPLGVNFHNRFLPWVRDVTAMVAAGGIGDVLIVEVEVGAGPRHYEDWRADPELAGLGAIHNVGVHALDFVGVILGAEPVEVSAMFDPVPSSDRVEMIGLVTVRFDNGTLAYFNCNERVPEPRNQIAIHGTRGRMVGEGFTRARVDGSLTARIDGVETTTRYPAPRAHRLTVAAFTAALLSGAAPDPSGVDGLRSARLCDAIGRSAREGRVVAVEPTVRAGSDTR